MCSTLPISSWRWWPTVNLGESNRYLAGSVGDSVQAVRIPAYLQTANSIAATHRIGKDQCSEGAAVSETVRHRSVNEDHLAHMRPLRRPAPTRRLSGQSVGYKQVSDTSQILAPSIILVYIRVRSIQLVEIRSGAPPSHKSSQSRH